MPRSSARRRPTAAATGWSEAWSRCSSLVAVGVGFALTSSSDETGKATADVPERACPTTGRSRSATTRRPTTVTIYEDPQCPICAAVRGDVAATRSTKAVEDGRVKVEYRIVSFLDDASTNDYSSRAANALYVVNATSGTEVFKAYHDLLYSSGSPTRTPPDPTTPTLVDWAVEAGADRAEVTQGIEDDVYHQYVIDAADQMSKDGVNGTPTVFIDGKVVEPGQPAGGAAGAARRAQGDRVVGAALRAR